MINLHLKNREELLQRFENWVEIPMIILVMVMIATLVIPLVIHLSSETHLALEVVDWIIWAIFALELSIRTYIADKRLAYLRKNWVDVLVVILPILRIFRIFRAARLLRTLRFIRVFAFFGKFTNEIRIIFSRHHFHYLLVVLLGLIAIGSALIYYFEQEMPGNSGNFTDAFWLIIVNVFSGGYADTFPLSPEARSISILIILFGTVLVSYFTAALASYFTEKGQDIEQERIEKKLDSLIEEVIKIKESVKK